jgi:hypothetical protein
MLLPVRRFDDDRQIALLDPYLNEHEIAALCGEPRQVEG